MVIRTKPAEPLAERLRCIRDGVCAAIREWGVASGAIEASFVGNNVRSAMALGQARAAAIIGLVDGAPPLMSTRRTWSNRP